MLTCAANGSRAARVYSHVPRMQGQILRKFMPKKLNPTVRKYAMSDTPPSAAPEAANTAVQARPTSPAFRNVPPTVPHRK